MAKSNSGGFGIGTIIFCIIMWNVFTGDDDNSDEAELAVEVQQQPEAEIVIESQPPTVADKLKEATDKMREGVQEAVEVDKEEIQTIKENMDQPEPVEDVITEDVNEKQEIITQDPESDEVKSIDESEDIPSTFKKL